MITRLHRVCLSLILAGRRPGTQRGYRLKWDKWVAWCVLQEPPVVNIKPEPHVLANCLGYFSEVLRLLPATLCVYRSAIVPTIRDIRGHKATIYASSAPVRSLLSGAKYLAAATASRTPARVVSLVLDRLASLAFEPLSEILSTFIFQTRVSFGSCDCSSM